MRFDLPASAEAFRTEVREFVRQHVTDEVVARAYRTGTMHDWGLHRALAEKGWLAAPWSPEDGGQGRSPFEMMVLLDEMHRAGAPLDGWITTMCGASAVKAAGTDDQRALVIKKVVAGEALIALGFSEPDAGSDVAAARTRADRDGDEWVINGQKMFTTMAHEAEWVFLLTRTDAASKHGGLTMFLVPLDSPGVTVDPVHTLGGERTNITFYTDVRVPDSARVGEVNGGWKILTLALNLERGSAFGAGSSFLGTMQTVLERTTGWARNATGPRGRVADDLQARRRIAKAFVDYEVSRLLNHRSIWLVDRGQMPDVEAAVAKVFATESLQRVCSNLLDLLGPDGVLDHRAGDRAPGHGEMEHAYRHGAVTTIYGGSSEVLRGIIAARGLGLPRA